MLKYHEQQTENFEKDPQSSAIVSLVISRQFLTRNDYVNTRKVAEPWIEKGYGSPDMLAFGQTFLGRAYNHMGETDKALHMFVKAEEFYSGSSEAGTIEHAAVMIEVFNLTKTPEDFKAARKVIDHLLETEENRFTHMYLNFKLSDMSANLNDWTTAHEHIIKSVDEFDASTINGLSGQDMVRTRVAKSEIFWNGDLENAEKQIKLAMELSENSKGESQSLGSQLQYRAILHNEREEYAAAIVDGQKALRLIEKYSGKSSDYYTILSQLAINYADMGDFTAAKDRLAELESYGKKPSRWTPFVRLYIDLKENGVESGQARLDAAEFNVQKAWERLPFNFYIRRMEKLGLTFPQPEGDIKFRPTQTASN